MVHMAEDEARLRLKRWLVAGHFQKLVPADQERQAHIALGEKVWSNSTARVSGVNFRMLTLTYCSTNCETVDRPPPVASFFF